MRKALIIVDMQNDYCEGGSMAYKKSLKIIPKINRLRDDFPFVIFTRDLHSENHCSFKQNGGKYPKHCIQGTYGSDIHKDIISKFDDIIINKGTLTEYDSDSIFYDASDIDKLTKLKNLLLVNKITDLYFCGNGLESNIFSSIIDAINFKFKCHIIINCVTYLNKIKAVECINYLKNLDVSII